MSESAYILKIQFNDAQTTEQVYQSLQGLNHCSATETRHEVLRILGDQAEALLPCFQSIEAMEIHIEPGDQNSLFIKIYGFDAEIELILDGLAYHLVSQNPDTTLAVFILTYTFDYPNFYIKQLTESGFANLYSTGTDQGIDPDLDKQLFAIKSFDEVLETVINQFSI